MTGLFIRNAAIVARPTGVCPSTRVASKLQAKCSDHCCALGLNKGTISPVSGSWASVKSDLYSLQERQAKQTFSKEVFPPLDWG